MSAARIHLLSTPTRALCGALPAFWTRELQAVTCHACINATELAPA